MASELQDAGGQHINSWLKSCSTCPLQFMSGSKASNQPIHQQRVYCVLQKRTCGPLIGGAEEEEVKGSAEPATGLPAAHIFNAVMFIIIKTICLCSLSGTAAATSRLMQYSDTAFGSQALYSTHLGCFSTMACQSPASCQPSQDHVTNPESSPYERVCIYSANCAFLFLTCQGDDLKLQVMQLSQGMASQEMQVVLSPMTSFRRSPLSLCAC